MVTFEFGFASTPRIHFRVGGFAALDGIVAGFGKRALIVTGGESFARSGHLEKLQRSLKDRSMESFHAALKGEPTPEWVDGTVKALKDDAIDVVVAVGGGSAMDAGKAVSAMLPLDDSVFDYLEGVGTDRTHVGVKIPFVAVPTTAGTGSEATKNAVLSRVGEGGFKKSLRHDNFVPDAAVIDPALSLTCPREVTAACGMDAFTQLMEAYLSTRASPITDALAWSGLKSVALSLIDACGPGAQDIGTRSRMAYGALISGIVLANAGLGLIHGLASPLGAAGPIPHGAACGTLAGAVTEAVIRKLHGLSGWNHPALEKYARLGALLSEGRDLGVKEGCDALVERLHEWVERLDMPRLGSYGLSERDLEYLAREAGNKNGPIPLEKDEIRELLLSRL